MGNPNVEVPELISDPFNSRLTPYIGGQQHANPIITFSNFHIFTLNDLPILHMQ